MCDPSEISPLPHGSKGDPGSSRSPEITMCRLSSLTERMLRVSFVLGLPIQFVKELLSFSNGYTPNLVLVCRNE